MRFLGLKMLFCERGIKVLESHWAETSFPVVVQKQFSSLSVLTLPGISWSVTPAGSPHPLPADPAPIALREEGGTRVIEGIVSYNSTAELVHFIAERIDPHGPGPLSEIKATASDNLAEIEEQLGLDHPRRRRAWTATSSLPLLKEDDSFLESMAPLEGKKQSLWVWKPRGRDEFFSLFAVESQREVSGHQVPVMKIVLPFVPLPEMDKMMSETPVLVFDGERVEWVDGMEEVPLELLEEIERDGALHCAADFDLLPLPPLEPLALVRIPPAAELKEHLSTKSRLHHSRPPAPLLNKPAYALDTRRLLPLAEDLPVLDTLEASHWFLSHVTRGIYLPQRPPRSYPLKLLPDRESYQALCQFRRL